MSKGWFFLSILIVFFLNTFSEACTTAIISGKATPDGRPLLWKHRDSDQKQNALRYFTDGKFPYIGLVNAKDTEGKEIWAGSNSAGFAIMNSASYNLKPAADSTKIKDREGELMKLALRNCRTLSDFERLLDTLPKPLGVESNFGVIDAEGGAAYYETDNFGYKKLDVNDPKIAPFGYLIHTNFSFTGRPDDGYGYIRYQAAEELFRKAAAANQLDARFILQRVSRSLKHALTGRDLTQNPPLSGGEFRFVTFRDFIPRRSTVSVVLVQGVKPGQNPDQTVLWTILGFPLTSVAFPLWVSAGNSLPAILTADASRTAPLCRASLKLKERCFPIKRGSGPNYLNLAAVLNRDGSGILQQILPFEEQIIQQAQKMIRLFEERGVREGEVKKFYRDTEIRIKDFMRARFKVNLEN